MPLSRRLVQDVAEYAAQWIDYRRVTLDIPGVSVAMGHGGELVLSKAFGLADVESATPMTTAHRFRIASHSKTFTATAVKVLAQRGDLSLDDPLSKWLDWVSGPLGRRTLRDLLTHSAGISRDSEDAPWWEARGPFLDEAGLRQVAADEPPVLENRERFKYSNIGYSLLGAVIEAASGQSYAEFVEAHIVRPLDMHDSGPEPRPEDVAAGRFATGYSSRRCGQSRFGFPHLDTRAMASATGWYATAEDLTRWGAAHFEGNDHILNDEAKRELHHGVWDVRGGRGGRYAMGFHASEIGGLPIVSHGGGFPGFITYTCIAPGDHLVVTVLTNAVDGPAEALCTGIVKLLGEGREDGDGDGDDGHRRQARFEGRFFSVWRTLDVAGLGDRLVAVDPDLPDPSVDLVDLEPVEGDDDVLRIIEAPGYGAPGELVRYSFDSAGAVAEVRFSGGRFLPWDRYREDVARFDRA